MKFSSSLILITIFFEVTLSDHLNIECSEVIIYKLSHSPFNVQFMCLAYLKSVM